MDGSKLFQKVPEATEYARRAYRQSGQTAHLDTLAQCLYANGDITKAVELLKECVKLEPNTSYFAQKLANWINRLPEQGITLMKNLHPARFKEFQKLENVGGHTIIRPCPQACWSPTLPKSEWSKAKDIYLRSNKGGGKWKFNSLPEQWNIKYRDQKMIIRPTNFGHPGLFAEAAENWQWLRDQSNPEIKALNMFAYTGGSSLAMASGGAQVTHLDAAKGIVDWAKLNANENEISNIRWIVDDVNRFLDREIRRENKYDALVMDPPLMVAAVKGEIWKIEEDIMPFLYRC